MKRNGKKQKRKKNSQSQKKDTTKREEKSSMESHPLHHHWSTRKSSVAHNPLSAMWLRGWTDTLLSSSCVYPAISKFVQSLSAFCVVADCHHVSLHAMLRWRASIIGLGVLTFIAFEVWLTSGGDDPVCNREKKKTSSKDFHCSCALFRLLFRSSVCYSLSEI